MERMHLVRFSKEGNCRRQRFIVKCGICGDTRIYENEDGSRLSINRPDPKSKRLDISYAKYIPIPESDLDFVESLLISRIKPLHNKNNGRTQLAEKFWKKDNKG